MEINFNEDYSRTSSENQSLYLPYFNSSNELNDFNQFTVSDLMYEKLDLDCEKTQSKTSNKESFDISNYMDMSEKKSYKILFKATKSDFIPDKTMVLKKMENRDLNLHQEEEGCCDSLPRGEMMRIKRLRTKKLLEQTRPGIKRDYYDENSNTLIKERKTKSKGTKIENKFVDDNYVKCLKNRISAQESRHKKQLIFNQIKAENQILTKQVLNLKNELYRKNEEIDHISKILNVCRDCSKIMRDKLNLITPNDITINLSAGRGCVKYGFISSLIVVICLIGMFYHTEDYESSSEKKQINNFTRRRLNNYYTTINQCSKNNSTDFDTSSNIIFEYLLKNISLIENEDKMENNTFSYYRYFKLNLNQFIRHIDKFKNITNRKSSDNKPPLIRTNSTKKTNSNKTNNLRKESKQEICLKKNLILNDIKIRCENPNHSEFRGIVFQNKTDGKSIWKSFIIMRDSDFNSLYHLLKKIYLLKSLLINENKE